MKALNPEKILFFGLGGLIGYIVAQYLPPLPDLTPLLEGAPMPFLVGVALFFVVFFVWVGFKLMRRFCCD